MPCVLKQVPYIFFASKCVQKNLLLLKKSKSHAPELADCAN